MTERIGEFDVIARHFRPLAAPAGRDLTDDAAVFLPPPGRELVVSSDCIVAGVHFFPDDPADAIAQKLLRVNLSDLAAMGAEPLYYTLCLSIPAATPDEWIARFAQGLAADQKNFGIALIGGDTTSTPGPISLSLTIFGHVAPGAAIGRNGARPGDLILVTGTIGDAALGLEVSLGKLADSSGYLRERYLRPSPRMEVARADLVHACIDLSDGLIQDIGHLARNSGVEANVFAQRIPLSDAARAHPADFTGGDDYELAMAVAPENVAALAAHAAQLGVEITVIGEFQLGSGQVIVLDADGRDVTPQKGGWSHLA